MPRRKRNLKSKQQLQFVQAPLDGASHPYGPKLQGARNPKIFLSDEQRQCNTGRSWVTPQFDTSMVSRTLHPHRRRGIRKGCSSRSVLDSSSLLTLPRLRKASVGKFPALAFERHATAPSRPPVARLREKAKLGGALGDKCPSDPVERGTSPKCSTEAQQSAPSLRKGSVEDAGVFKSTPATAVSRRDRENKGLDCTINTPVGCNQPTFTDRENKGLDCTINTPVGCNQPTFTDSGFTPPDIETPDMLQGDRTNSATQEARLSKLRLLFPQTPLQAPPPAVLVSDTPEEHYGKSWRRSRLSFR